jgi:thiamine biosynthesis lipoprotein
MAPGCSLDLPASNRHRTRRCPSEHHPPSAYHREKAATRPEPEYEPHERPKLKGDTEMRQGNKHQTEPNGAPIAAAQAHNGSGGRAPSRELSTHQTGTALWPVWDSTLHLVVTERNCLAEARKLVIEQVTAIDAACNPFRPDSEVRALQRARGRPVRLSVLLAELVAVSLRAALLSDGCLDLISGEVLRAPGAELLQSPLRGAGTDRRRAPDWRSVRLLDELPNDCDLTVPAGTTLDLSAMAGAYAVDRCVRLIHERCDVGVRVAIGGDVASAGQPPAGGWRTLIRSTPAVRTPPLTLDCTMSTTATPVSQQSRDRDAPLYSTFRPGSRSAVPLWRSVSVAAAPCTYAKALGMAATMRGHAAPDWLRGLGVSARLVAANGEVVTVGRWPTHGLG